MWRFDPGPHGFVPKRSESDALNLTARAAPREHVAAPAVARAVEERLRAAHAIREHVIEFAFGTADPTDAVFAVDGEGALLAANATARRSLLAACELPPAVRRGVRAALAQGPPAQTELEVEWPGRAARLKLLAWPLRYEQQLIGAVLRAVFPAARSLPPPPQRPAARYGFAQIHGESEGIRVATALARSASRNDLPVVLHGESGTGKELFAQAIHTLSHRAGGPFVAVNCGCLPAALLEAELFGYEPGTFTGGRREGNAGKFEKASGGTIFLDEVIELSPQAQAALLRVVQEREVVRLGGSSPRRIDIRVIAATNRSLGDEVRAGRFRADLFFRLNVLTIAIPPLRERREDVALLAREFLTEAEAEVGRSGLALSDDVLRALEAYRWPGNVRELRNVLLRAAATARATVIGLRDLPEEVVDVQGAGATPALGRTAPRRSVSGERAMGRDALMRALQESEWNVARTAQALRVSRMTLYRWLSKHRIER